MEPIGAVAPAGVWMKPSSESAYSAPASQPGRSSATHCAPKRLPASSSAVASKVSPRLSGTRARLMARTAMRWRMPVDFMSSAPRP